jgi:hypothetical protein
VAEVGAGQTTIHILDALHRTVVDDRKERARGRPAHGVAAYYDRPYRPHLTVLDDLSNRDSTARGVADVVAHDRRWGC